MPPQQAPRHAETLIALAQKLARDSEQHALLSVSLANQADRLMNAGLRLLATDGKPPRADAAPNR